MPQTRAPIEIMFCTSVGLSKLGLLSLAIFHLVSDLSFHFQLFFFTYNKCPGNFFFAQSGPKRTLVEIQFMMENRATVRNSRIFLWMWLSKKWGFPSLFPWLKKSRATKKGLESPFFWGRGWIRIRPKPPENQKNERKARKQRFGNQSRGQSSCGNIFSFFGLD